MPGVLNLTYVFQFVVLSLDQCPFAQHDFVMDVHQRVLHVLLYLGHQVHVVDEELFEQVLADVSPVGKQLAEQPGSETLVLQRLAVVSVSGCELPLYDLATVVYHDMQFESVEPSHCALALGCPALHGLMAVLALEAAGNYRCGIDDGNACTLTQGAGLQEQQQVQAQATLSLHEAVVRQHRGKFGPHVLAHMHQVERLQVAETLHVEQHPDSHYLAVGHQAWAIAVAFAVRKDVFFELRGKKFAKFVHNTENFH